ncbi:MAG TPA: tetratricopeptide repeat protein [Chloroflexia bacterium]|nr:tetratricopeptide repeat protein [Chloroflexia bacterium]
MDEHTGSAVILLLTEGDAATASLPPADRTALADVLVAHGGILLRAAVGTGAAFTSPAAALAAALAVQRAAQGSGGAAGRVRVALHTGPAAAGLEHTARLLAVAHGGQVLLSRAAQQAGAAALPAGASLRDLGAHRFRDLVTTDHLFQLVVPDLPAEFPPPRTLAQYATNLPTQPTALIGRAHELAALAGLIPDAAGRVITLTGPGGTGKTRLALQAAAALLDTFADGIYFVPLASVYHPAMVVPTIAGVLGIAEVRHRPLFLSLTDYLAERQMLLVLDNFEQVLAAARWVATLRAAAPNLRVLVTSRERLHLPGEQEFPVPPLPLPDPAHLPPPAVLAEIAAVALFVERARAVRPDFALTAENAAAVAAICARLDGLPLALEVAAARSKLFTPTALLERLEGRVTLRLGGGLGTPAHQQTLHGTIDWSYDLLRADEQILLRRLAVFAGGWTLEAAEAVTAGADLDDYRVRELLLGLVNKSLVVAEEAAGYRFLELLRQYAAEKLDAAGETEALRRRHASYFLALAEEAAPALRSGAQRAAVARLEGAHDNLRAALEWALTADAATTLRLVGSLWYFWGLRGYWSEGHAWLLKGLQQPGAQAPTAARARALTGVVALDAELGNYADARARGAEALAIWQALGDRAGRARTQAWLAAALIFSGDGPGARLLLEESLAICREVGDPWGCAHALNILGLVRAAQGDSAAACAAYEECLALFRQVGDQWATALPLANFGRVVLFSGDPERAAALATAGLALAREVGNKGGIVRCCLVLAEVARRTGALARASALYREALTLEADLKNRHNIEVLLEGLAAVAAGAGTGAAGAQQAARLLGAAAALRESLGLGRSPYWTAQAPIIAAAQAQADPAAWDAAWAAGQALSLAEAIASALREVPASPGETLPPAWSAPATP